MPERIKQWAAPLQRVPFPVVWVLHAGIFLCSLLGAFLLRFDLAIPAQAIGILCKAAPVFILSKALVFRIARLDRGWWRFFSSRDALRLCAVNAIASATSGAATLILVPTGFPRSAYVLDLLLCTTLSAAVRLTVRIVAESAALDRPGVSRARVLIYGAGGPGEMLLREIRSNPGLAYDVQGFIDDDPAKDGLILHGVRVLGCGKQLAQIVRRLGIEEILIALPTATSAEIAAAVQHCKAAGIRCKTIPSMAEILSGHRRPTAIREIDPEQLLGRPANRLSGQLVRGQIEDRVVLVTGAAGSIGSELCRQIARLRPRILIGFDVAESGLFHLDREIREAYPFLDFRPEIGSIQNRRRLEEIMSEYRPQALYHAAAYKHVPLMEAHVLEAIENNVFGTYQLAACAAEYAVSNFVMISSDKAVRPANVMGATKRAAEMIVQAFDSRQTVFVSVRFGNVLGSNGSVVPIFKEQIAKGGPVRVTHPEMRRYFMTIPEAVQLVLEASTLGTGGEVFVLDMGDPVKVLDLARNLILLSGLRPDLDIPIEFTGLRPGEKLYEELSRVEEHTARTNHEKIKIFTGTAPSWITLDPLLDRLRHACTTRDTGAAILLLKEMVPDYNPDVELLRKHLCAERRQPSTRSREEQGLYNLMAAVRKSGLQARPIPLARA